MDIELNTEKMTARIEDGIGWMTFNNPERHNALALEMWQGMGDILEAFNSNENVRVVIMRGAGGKSFVSGADISEFDNKRSNADQRREYGKIAGRGSMWLNKLKKPLIALVEGYCIGGGLATALSADIRFATPDSKFGIPAAKLGLGYEFEGLAKLARVVGPSHARDIMFSARFFEAAEAKSMNLINFIESRESIEEACIKYAHLIAKNAPLTVGAAKMAINVWENGSPETEIDLVKQAVDKCFNSDDYKEGRAAFKDKRTPAFQGK